MWFGFVCVFLYCLSFIIIIIIITINSLLFRYIKWSDFFVVAVDCYILLFCLCSFYLVAGLLNSFIVAIARKSVCLRVLCVDAWTPSSPPPRHKCLNQRHDSFLCWFDFCLPACPWRRKLGATTCTQCYTRRHTQTEPPLSTYSDPRQRELSSFFFFCVVCNYKRSA